MKKPAKGEIKKVSFFGKVNIYYHKTWQLIHIIKGKCDLIITMNITNSMLKSVADKKTIVYFVSCYKDIVDKVKKRYVMSSSHLKLYRTKDKIYISTANLSLSNWDEITVELERTEEIDNFIREITENLQLKNEFMRSFW